MEITRGTIACAIKTLIYGPEGIGKSTLAANFPEPVFIDTEGSTKQLDVARLPAPETWNEILDEVKYVYQNPECCKTLVIDTADWAEMLCIKEMLEKDGMKSIEDYGYGKGYVKLAEKFKQLLDELTKVIEAGIHVVLTAHAMMRKFEQPDEIGAYDRWELKLQKKTAPLLKEWADMVLFCNYKTYVVNVDNQGAAKGKNKAKGGERVIYTSHHNCWDAKNRFGLPDTVPMGFDSLTGVITGDLPKMSAADRIPEKLKKLMVADEIGEWDIQNLASGRGWVESFDVPIYRYPSELIKFLTDDWGKVKEAVAKMRNEMEIPFLQEEK